NAFKIAPGAKPAFAIDGLNAPHPTIPFRKRLDNISFHVKPGEILGVSGLMGAGRSEMIMAIFGSLPGATYEKMEINGKTTHVRAPHHAIRQGLALATEDRKRYGLVLASPVRVNMSLSSLSRFARFGFVEAHHEKRACHEYASR